MTQNKTDYAAGLSAYDLREPFENVMLTYKAMTAQLLKGMSDVKTY